MNIIEINDTPIKHPLNGGYSVTVSDLDSENSTRSETGVLNRDRIRAGIYKLAVKWSLTTSELETLLNAISGDSFDVKFFFGELLTKKMYASDKSINLKSTDTLTSHWDVSISFTEF